MTKTTCWNCKTPVDRIIYKNMKQRPVCPCCKCLYPEKPKLEAELSIAQDNYLQNKTPENLSTLFVLMEEMTKNVVSKKLKSTNAKLNNDDFKDKVQWTLEILHNYYVTKPNFKITTAFNVYINDACLYPIYNAKDKERGKKEISIYTPIKSHNSDIKQDQTILDKISENNDHGFGIEKIEDKIDYDIKKDKVIEETIEFIKTCINTLYKHETKNNKPSATKDAIMLSFLFKHFIYGKNDRFMTEIYRCSDLVLLENFNKSKELLKEHLYKMSME